MVDVEGLERIRVVLAEWLEANKEVENWAWGAVNDACAGVQKALGWMRKLGVRGGTPGREVEGE